MKVVIPTTMAKTLLQPLVAEITRELYRGRQRVYGGMVQKVEA
jgi:hypothetical protein